MDILYSINRKFIRMLANILSIVIILAITFPAVGSVYAQEYNPWFTVFPEQGVVEGWDWPLDATIYMTIDDPGTPDISPDYWQDGTMEVVPWDPDSGGTWLWIDFSEEYSIKPGDIVTLSLKNDGDMERSHEVQNLLISEIDPYENIVSGMANDGQVVVLWSWEDPDGRRIETDGSGNWAVDFDDVGFDLEPGYHVRAEVWGVYGNDTAVDRYVTNPHFTVFPEWEWFDGLDWPDGATVAITVEGKEDVCTTEGTSSDYFFNGGFPEGCDVEFGDMVTFTDGTTTRVHQVQNLAVTNVNQEDDTIKGIADAGVEVYVWPHATGQEQLTRAKTNGQAEGKWNADFSEIFDLVPGECGRSEIRDEFSNSTAVDWCVPSTRFTVWPEWNYLEAYEWPNRDEVSITVAGKDACSADITPSFPEWDPWNTFFSVNFPEECTLEAGDLITLSSETFNLTHQIQDLTITDVNLEYDTVEGTASFSFEQYILHTWIHDVDGSYIQLSAEDGNWLADFDAEGFDLQPGMGGRVELVDQASNATAVDWHIPLPSFAAYMPSAIEGYDWPMGHEITLTINGDEYPEHAFSEQRPDFPEGETRVLFELWQHDVSLEVNDHVVMTDLAIGFSKELWVADLQVTNFNLGDKTVSGIYDPDRSFWTQLDGQDPVDIVFDGNTWVAAFVDMSLGAWGYIAQDDDDHDGTVWDFQVPGGQAGNFTVQWSQTNPEEVTYLRWNGSDNLTKSTGDLEFFGNSWVSENEGTDDFFFASLVGWCTTGTWEGISSSVNINSISSGCPGSADIPVNTQYQFFDDKPDLIMIQRTFDFGDTPYTHDVRPFIPRLYPWDGYTQVMHPNDNGDTLVTETWSVICDFGCVAQSWDGSWFAVHNPDTGVGMIVQSTSSPISLWLDNDAGSFTNSSSILLLQPNGGFIGIVSETEYLCFYDTNTWTPSLTLPGGCQP